MQQALTLHPQEASTAAGFFCARPSRNGNRIEPRFQRFPVYKYDIGERIPEKQSLYPLTFVIGGTHRGENFRGLALLTSRKSLISGIRTIPGFASKIPGFTPKTPGFPVFFPT
jgi:hypothetical protein